MANDSPDLIAEKIKSVLEKTPYPCSQLSRISGGNANFTYRGHLKAKSQETGWETIVIKHAESYLASNEEWKLDAERADYEYFMLSKLSHKPGTKSGNFLVRTPKVWPGSIRLPEFGLPHTMIVEDLTNSLTIKEYLSRHGASIESEDARKLGHALGSWLKSYHEWLNADNEEANAMREKLKGNQAMVDAREGLYIGSYKESMEKFVDLEGPDAEAFKLIEERVKKMTREGGQGIHGDFWTGNMILKDKPLITRTEGVDPPTEIFILDFEVSQLGCRSQDFAQCLAELYLVHHFYGSNSPLEVMQGVVEKYASPADHEDIAFQTAMHFGIHIVVIPWRFGWPTGEKMQSCVEYGNQCLIGGLEKDEEFFRGGPLGCLFPA